MNPTPQTQKKKRFLVVVGDSLSQGFRSGVINQPEFAYSAILAKNLNLGPDEFLYPKIFNSANGLGTVNLEALARTTENIAGATISVLEVPVVSAALLHMMDLSEDFWERWKGSEPLPQDVLYDNLSVWGFTVQDSYTINEDVCKRYIKPPHDDLVAQFVESSFYRTVRHVLNPTYQTNRTQWDCVQEISTKHGGIQNLVVALGANNALLAAITLNPQKVERDEDCKLLPDGSRGPGNLFSVKLFKKHYKKMVEEYLKKIVPMPERVFFATIPCVTVAPLIRGVGEQDSDGYFERYHHFFRVKDPQREFIPLSDAGGDFITREQAREIDTHIKAYNDFIKTIVQRRNAEVGRKEWFIIDWNLALSQVAYRRNEGVPQYDFPRELVEAMERHSKLRRYLRVNDEGKKVPNFDPRFLFADKDGRILQGGIISLDGIHPTVLGQGLLAEELRRRMKEAGVEVPASLDWDDILESDDLLNRPPRILESVAKWLNFVNRFTPMTNLLSKAVQREAIDAVWGSTIKFGSTPTTPGVSR